MHDEGLNTNKLVFICVINNKKSEEDGRQRQEKKQNKKVGKLFIYRSRLSGKDDKVDSDQ